MLTCMELVDNRIEYLEARKSFDKNNMLKNAIKQRDNYRCVKCGIHESYATLHIHHIEPVLNHPEKALDKNNLVTLCTCCHEKFHSIFGHGISHDFGHEEFLNFLDGVYNDIEIKTNSFNKEIAKLEQFLKEQYQTEEQKEEEELRKKREEIRKRKKEKQREEEKRKRYEETVHITQKQKPITKEPITKEPTTKEPTTTIEELLECIYKDKYIELIFFGNNKQTYTKLEYIKNDFRYFYHEYCSKEKQQKIINVINNGGFGQIDRNTYLNIKKWNE